MKKLFRTLILATVMLLAVGVNSAEAQLIGKIRTEWGVGVGVGYTFAKVVSAAPVQIAPRVGLQAHADIAVRFGRFLALETEIIYTGSSMDVATALDEHRVRCSTLDIPVLLGVRALGGRIRVNCGPMFTVLSKGEYMDDGEEMMFGQVAPTWGLTAGLSVGLGRHFRIYARYIMPLESVTNQFGGTPGAPGLEFETRYDRIMAGLTVSF